MGHPFFAGVREIPKFGNKADARSLAESIRQLKKGAVLHASNSK